ncbi:16S rRNA (cytosine(967)-C(5))-methyltransferase RsmB [Thermohalobacter berrensis]|uniref:16S rRNA (cytosine(967)-C(5))-methyltransferase n=1 Tax=Thermohalobacter berrensis TaxID=99594 RepID=A0A419TA53_9FIRM|nr:16S rRNA (cytosine(967)-C(5))-methyltransferase RsmB [Thermohalobacter berrensis]RKD34364.1 16S rRNA (cytosine(967)-C(5))-methyltransferase [Thermohalobacter berrensis]
MGKNSRQIALRVLYEINEKKAYSNISLNKNIDYDVGNIDDSFIRELVYGVLENRLYIDHIIKQFSKVKFKKISPMIREILRMGIYQIIFMDRIPDSAACNESVKLAKKYGHRGVYGFVNGVLRNIVRNKNNIKLPNKSKKPIEHLSLKYSHPKWMVERWIAEYGFDFTESLLAENNKKPKLNIRVNTLKITREELMDILERKGLEVQKTKYANDGIIVENPKKITNLEEFKNGFFQIQDESSMLVAQIMEPKEDSLVVDVCSAPGGKATHLAQKMNNKGKIISRDIYDHKLNLINKSAKRLGIDIIDTEKFDALKIDEKLIGKADFCLVDAPCSGLGLLRRKPDIRWNKNRDDLKEIASLQYKILKNASKYLKPEGTLIYSTCTIEKEENIELVKRFLEKNSNFKLIGFDHLINYKENLDTLKDGYIELYPHIHRTDGFFIAKLIKLS